MTTMTAERHVAHELRDLDETAFKEHYSCDRLTASILVNRFRYVNAHMSTKLVSNAFSIVIREMADFCTTIQGPPELEWAMPAASLTNPVHWGPVTDAVGIVLEEVGLESLRSGDVVVANDSYRTGKHLNDISFIRPLFHDDRLIGAVHVTAHQLDVGSRVAGGFDLMSQSIWEDGLVLPPMLLYSGGRPVRSTFSLIAANTRWPEVILADLQVIRSTLDLGERLLMESIERYGIDAYLGAIRYACDVGNEAMHRALEVLPDGSYDGELALPDDSRSQGPTNVIRVHVTKRGEHFEFDFSGSSIQTTSSLNSSWLDAKTGVTIALKLLFDRISAPSSGSLRNFDFLLPPGSILNANPPAATMYYCSIVDAVMKATINALNPAIGMDAIAADTPMGGGGHRASGTTSEGTMWEVTTAESNVANFPKGATRNGDADGYGLLAWMNMPALSTEVIELANPLIILEAEAVPDSSGPGYHRGGAGMVTTIQYIHGGTHHDSITDPDCTAPGVCGGHAGRPARLMVFDDGRGTSQLGVLPSQGTTPWSELPPDGVLACNPGAVFRRVMAAGGGWGHPFDREPERVLRDVRDGYVTIDSAASDYGVVVIGDPHRDPEHLLLDVGATAQRRGGRRP